MNLDRGLIKHQAKELIKGKVMKLFVAYFIIWICMTFLSFSGSALSAYLDMKYPETSSYNNFYSDFYDDFYSDDYTDDDSEYYDSFSNFGKEGSDFYSFGQDDVMPSAYVVDTAKATTLRSVADGLASLGSLAAFLLAPLMVTLAAFFVMFIRGKEMETDAGVKFIFKNTFNETYGKKLGAYFLRGIITFLLSFLFFIPGIIFNYSSYFTYQILCDYPELKPMDAIKLSKKMIKGNRTELFLLDLSFIPWIMLCCFIFPIIYVIPYYETTVALYYENVRIRALQQGRITEDDFLSERQKMQKYGMNGNAGQYYAPNGPQAGGYQQGPVNSQQNPNNSYNPAASSYQPQQNAQQPYYQPQAQQQPAEPVQPHYEPPVQEEPAVSNEEPIVSNNEPIEVDYEPVSGTEPEPSASDDTPEE